MTTTFESLAAATLRMDSAVAANSAGLHQRYSDSVANSFPIHCRNFIVAALKAIKVEAADLDRFQKLMVAIVTFNPIRD